MAKNIVLIIIIILIIAIIGIGGYFVYEKYFVKAQSNSQNQMRKTANSPKDIYLEFVNKIEQASTIKEIFDIDVEYQYFATVADRESAISSNANTIQDVKNDPTYLQSVKDGLKYVFRSSITENISGDSATITITTPETSNEPESSYTLNMKKVGETWKMVNGQV